MRTAPSLLRPDELAAALPGLHGWAVQGNGLFRRFEFAGFAEAFGFMAACAVEAQAMNHHPEWSNVYHRVDVRLVTHDAGGLTGLDLALARRMNALAAGFCRAGG